MSLKDFISKNIIDLGDSDNEKKEEKNQPSSIQQPSSLPQLNFNTSPTPQTLPSNHQIDDNSSKKFREHFDNLFKESNLPGPDYFEFKTMINSMSSLPEINSYPAVFAGLQVQGLTYENLLNSTQEYLKILEKDYTEFQNTVVSTLNGESVEKQKSVDNMNQLIEQKCEEIKKLNTEIVELQTQVRQENQEIIALKQKTEYSTNNYVFAYQARKAEINSDIQKIHDYLKTS